MAYTVENGMWSSVFAVPCEVIDKHLKLSGATAWKALLVVLRQGGRAEPEEIAERLGISVADVQDAMHSWQECGVIGRDGASYAAQTPPREEKPAERPELCVKDDAAERADPSADKPGASRRRLNTRQINEMSRGDENIAYLLQESQAVLGKPLTPVATDTIVALYGYYGMQPDMVLMLLQYCISKGKDSMRYVEKVAASWIEQGIDTHEKAEQEILRAAQRDEYEHKIRKLFGIYDRALAASEKKYILSWETHGCDPALVQLAFERAVEVKGKLSFPYINGIVQNWIEQGIVTARQAAEEIARGKGKKPVAAALPGASYDMSELEKLVTYGDL